MKITIVTVAYNSAFTIADTIHSVVNQKYTNFEHLVIDGKSTDETVNVVKEHHHQRLVLISETDSGIYDAMNKGLVHASGDIIGFLNADDFYADNEVLIKIAKAFENPQIEACFGDLLYVTKDNRKVVRYWKSSPFLRGNFARGWCPAHPTFYIRRSALERLGPFDLTYRLAADAEFMMRYLERGSVRSIYLPHVLVRMRVGGATNQSWRNIWHQNSEIFQALRKNCISHTPAFFWFHKLTSRIWQRLTGLLLWELNR